MKNTFKIITTFHNSIFPSLLLLILLSSCTPNLHILKRYSLDAKTPEQVVELYQKAFGTTRMDEIGPYTTENYRDNMPITVWINKTWNLLNQVNYEKIAFKLLDI